jgi:micrococcal nuclease
VPILAGSAASLLCALACCALLVPAALSPQREVADVSTLAPTMGADSARAGGALAATQTEVVPPVSPTITRTQQPTARPATSTSRPTRTPTTQPTVDPLAGPEQIGLVVDVIDGDTIEVEIEDQAYRVRYIGMDAPEAGALCGDDATDANAELVTGQQVRLVRDVSQTDQYDRLLRYVYVGDVFVNAELIRRGVAEAKRYAPDIAQAAALEAAEADARAAQVACYALGVFGGVPAAAVATPVTRADVIPVVPAADTAVADTPVPAADTPVPTAEPPTLEPPTAEPPTAAPPPAAPAPANCDPSYPDVCIPPAPPDLDCGDISFRRFRVLPPDPHRFDGDNDGVGCESD